MQCHARVKELRVEGNRLRLSSKKEGFIRVRECEKRIGFCCLNLFQQRGKILGTHWIGLVHDDVDSVDAQLGAT